MARQALATSISSAVHAATLMVLLSRRLGRDIWKPEIFSRAFRFLACGGIMALCLLGMSRWLPFDPGAGAWATLGWLGGAMALGLLSYGVSHLALSYWKPVYVYIRASWGKDNELQCSRVAIQTERARERQWRGSPGSTWFS